MCSIKEQDAITTVETVMTVNPGFNVFEFTRSLAVLLGISEKDYGKIDEDVTAAMYEAAGITYNHCTKEYKTESGLSGKTSVSHEEDAVDDIVLSIYGEKEVAKRIIVEMYEFLK